MRRLRQHLDMSRARLIAFVVLSIVCLGVLPGCTLFNVNIGKRTEDPLKEITLKGKGREKVLLIPIRGLLSDAPERGILSERPSIVQEVVARLEKAERDSAIK